MRISVNTELGEFKFNLSQTSVIFLLGLIQQIEEEGDREIAINDKVYNIKRIVDKNNLEDDGAEHGIINTEDSQVAPNSKLDEEELIFPEGDEVAAEEQEDFGKMLDDYEKKQKRQWNDTPQITRPDGGKYKGFLFIKCDNCGETRGFCAKQPISEYRCNSCGGRTKLKDLRRMFMDCECGKHSRYYTNETAEVVTHNCIECGSPVDMMLNSRRTAYISIGGGSTKKESGGYSRIATAKHKW